MKGQPIKYPPLPIMQCDTHCGECRGVVLWYQGGTCTVYEVRLGICRLFGHTEDLTCSKGYNVNVGSKLRRQWNAKLAAGKTIRILHEVFDDFKQIIREGMKALK